jgi:hypothetical protein
MDPAVVSIAMGAYPSPIAFTFDKGRALSQNQLGDLLRTDDGLGQNRCYRGMDYD